MIGMDVEDSGPQLACRVKQLARIEGWFGEVERQSQGEGGGGGGGGGGWWRSCWQGGGGWGGCGRPGRRAEFIVASRQGLQLATP